jgi:DNA-binding phage protein
MFRANKIRYGQYDAMERLNETAEKIADYLHDILGELEAHRAMLESIQNSIEKAN